MAQSQAALDDRAHPHRKRQPTDHQATAADAPHPRSTRRGARIHGSRAGARDPGAEGLDRRDAGEFTYEVQEVGVGEDLYQGTFSWSPYLNLDHAHSAGFALARLHTAAEGYDAPARPPRPLVGRFNVFSTPDPIAAIEHLAAERPALGDFLAARDWRADVERVLLPFHSGLPEGREPLWTHNDWHGTNLLWTHDTPTSIIDFGLADRTTALHDLAVAIERFAIDWISIRDGGPANAQVEQLRAFLASYDRATSGLDALFPLVHAEYELSEIDYFLSVVPGANLENAEIAYRDWFLGHAQWSRTEEGQAFLGLLGA